jgi:hypothetical protein
MKARGDPEDLASKVSGHAPKCAEARESGELSSELAPLPKVTRLIPEDSLGSVKTWYQYGGCWEPPVRCFLS